MKLKRCLLAFHLLAAAFLLANSLCLGQTITIRIIDQSNGHPLPDQQVSISMGYEKREKTPKESLPMVRFRTDSEGKGQVRLPKPPPSYLSMLITISSAYLPYDSPFTAKTSEILKSGIVKKIAESLCERCIVPEAVAGEVLFLTLPYTIP
jgi:hypothetical protein